MIYKDIGYFKFNFDIKKYDFIKSPKYIGRQIEKTNEIWGNSSDEIGSFQYAILTPFVNAVLSEDFTSYLNGRVFLGEEKYPVDISSDRIFNTISIRIKKSYLSNLILSGMSNEIVGSNQRIDFNTLNFNFVDVILPNNGKVYSPDDLDLEYFDDYTSVKNEIESILDTYNNYTGFNATNFFTDEGDSIKFIPIRFNGIYPIFQFSSNSTTNFSFTYTKETHTDDGTTTTDTTESVNANINCNGIFTVNFSPLNLLGTDYNEEYFFFGGIFKLYKEGKFDNLLISQTEPNTSRLFYQKFFPDGIYLLDSDGTTILSQADEISPIISYEYDTTNNVDSTTTEIITIKINLDFTNYFNSNFDSTSEFVNVSEILNNNNIHIKAEKYKTAEDNVCGLEKEVEFDVTATDTTSDYSILIIDERYTNFALTFDTDNLGFVYLDFTSTDDDNNVIVEVNQYAFPAFFTKNPNCRNQNNDRYKKIGINVYIPPFSSFDGTCSNIYSKVSKLNSGESDFGYYFVPTPMLETFLSFSQVSEYSSLPLAIFEKVLTQSKKEGEEGNECKELTYNSFVLYPFIKDSENNIFKVDFNIFKDNYLIDVSGLYVISRLKISFDFFDTYKNFVPLLSNKNLLPVLEFVGDFPYTIAKNQLAQVLQPNITLGENTFSANCRDLGRIIEFNLDKVINEDFTECNINYDYEYVLTLIVYDPANPSNEKDFVSKHNVTLKDPGKISYYIRKGDLNLSNDTTTINIKWSLKNTDIGESKGGILGGFLKKILFGDYGTAKSFGLGYLLCLEKPQKRVYSGEISVDLTSSDLEEGIERESFYPDLTNVPVKHLGWREKVIYNTDFVGKSINGSAFYYYSLDSIFTNKIKFAPIYFQYTPQPFETQKFNKEAKLVKDLNISLKFSEALHSLLSNAKNIKIVYRRHISSLHDKSNPESSNIVLFTGEINQVKINENKIILIGKTTDLDQEKKITSSTSSYCRQEFKSFECGVKKGEFCNKTFKDCIRHHGSKIKALKHFGGFLRLLDNTKNDFIDKMEI